MGKETVIRTSYSGVFYTMVSRTGYNNQRDKSFFVRWKDKEGKTRSEHVGRQHRDGMSPLKASKIRAQLIEGELATKKEKKRQEELSKENHWTLDHIWEQYLRSNPHLRGTRTSTNMWKKHIRPNFGHLLPEELKESDFEEFRDFLTGDRFSHKYTEIYARLYPDKYQKGVFKGHSKRFVNSVLELLRRINNWGTNRIKINDEFIKGFRFKVRLIKNAEVIKDGYLSISERGSFIKTVRQYALKYPHIGNLLEFYFLTGCRKSEGFRLCWDDIKWDEEIITIRETKSGKPQEIPLTKSVRTLLENTPRVEGSPYVFPSLTGRRLTDITRTAKRLFMEAGLPKQFTIHSLRHCYGCMLAEAGKSMETIRELMRHHSVLVTERYYVRYSPQYRGKEAKVIDDILEEALGKEKGKVIQFQKGN